MMRNDMQCVPAFTQPDKGETHQRRRGQLKRTTNLRIAEIVQRRGRFSGFGKILAVSTSHRTIYALKSVRAKPKVLLHSS